MKKLLSILVIGVVLFLPLGAKALDLGFNCEKSCRNEDTGVCEQRCTLSISGNTNPEGLTSVTPTFTITGDADKVRLGSLTAASDNIIASSSRTGDVITMEFVFTGAITEESFDLGTLVLELDDNATDCSGKFALNGVEYPEIKIEITEEVETGVALPLTILACGVGAGAVIYVVTKKNKKIYKI